jgi:hypothetical protein
MLMTEEKQTKEKESVDPKEKLDQQDFRNITIYHIHKDVVDEFKEWCKVHAGNKFPAGIQLLLSRSKVFELMSNFDTRIKALEHNLSMLLNRQKSGEGHSEEKPKVKTIGGGAK